MHLKKMIMREQQKKKQLKETYFVQEYFGMVLVMRSYHLFHRVS